MIMPIAAYAPITGPAPRPSATGASGLDVRIRWLRGLETGCCEHAVEIALLLARVEGHDAAHGGIGV